MHLAFVESATRIQHATNRKSGTCQANSACLANQPQVLHAELLRALDLPAGWNVCAAPPVAVHAADGNFVAYRVVVTYHALWRFPSVTGLLTRAIDPWVFEYSVLHGSRFALS